MWLNAAAVACCILLVLGLMAMIAVPGLGHFWPARVHQVNIIEDGEQQVLAGQIRDSESVDAQRLRESGLPVPESLESVRRYLLKVGNRDVTGQDFVWVPELLIRSRALPEEIVVLEREEWGNFYGYIQDMNENGEPVPEEDLWASLEQRLERVESLRDQIHHVERDEIGTINYRLNRLRLDERRLELDGVTEPSAFDSIRRERDRLGEEYQVLEALLGALNRDIARDAVVMRTASGDLRQVPLRVVMDAFRPNAMGWTDRVAHFFKKGWQFIVEEPREANTEGGIFPAIYGTVLMVLLMSVFVTPLGVVAAVYLKEYARQGLLTRTIRVAVNNLAGVPSIVYGVFGLGFFIYTLGGSIDRLFFPEALPSPTFGTGGLFWASLTLALLTLPVVIVSTEEGLARIPRAIREGSLALGATRWETLWRTVLPMASPGIMTGMILAVARAAGEVAPLMLVGVVKLAPSLPLDGNYPFLHPERKFMHLGFHIYDVGFQSPNVEAARPLVYATALLLVVVTVLLNLAAIRVRNRLRERYRGLET